MRVSYIINIIEVKTIKPIIIVTGTPGVGKTTVSKRLASRLDATYISLSEIVIAENLVISEDKERNTLVADTKRLTERLKRILDDSRGNLVIDGHYAVEVVQKEIITIVFVLRRDPRELKRILEERGYSEKKVWENIGAEILDVCLCEAIAMCGVNKVCEIDVTEKTLDSTVDEMLFIINGNQGCRIGVNWLRKLENAGKLEDFIKKLILS